MSFLLRFVVQRLKIRKDSLQTDWRSSGLFGKVASWKGGHSWLWLKHCSLFDGQCRVWALARLAAISLALDIKTFNMLPIPNFMVPIPPTSIAVSSTLQAMSRSWLRVISCSSHAHLVLILCSSRVHLVLVLCSSCAHLVFRGAKLSVVKKGRRKVLEEVSINVPIIARKYLIMYLQWTNQWYFSSHCSDWPHDSFKPVVYCAYI